MANLTLLGQKKLVNFIPLSWQNYVK